MPGVRRTLISGGIAAAWLLGALPLLGQETPGVHHVRRGDTLWDLAARYLADPFRWPEIQRLNSDVVEDPHWIYPGEVLRLPGGVPRADAAAVVAEGARRHESFEAPSLFDENPSLGATAGVSIEATTRGPVVSFSDFYRVGFVAEEEELAPLGRTARVLVENPLDLNLPPAARLHHRVVLELGGAETSAGDVWQAIQWGRPLGAHGRIAHSVALLEVTSAEGDTARATVTHVFGAFKAGDPVMPAEPYAMEAGVVPVRVEEELTGRLIGLETEQPLVGPGDAVFLDLGAEDGVRPGDEFAVFGRAVGAGSTARLDDALATVRVARVRPRTSTALVVALREAGAEPGAPVRLVRRLP